MEGISITKLLVIAVLVILLFGTSCARSAPILVRR